HFQIDEADGIVGCPGEFDSSLSIGRGIHAIAILAQPSSHGFAHHVFIVDNQNWPILFHTPPSQDANLCARCVPHRAQYRAALASTIPICVERLIAQVCSEQCTRPNVCPISCRTSLVRRSRKISSRGGSP